MALKRLFVDIQDDLFDCWNLISAERGPNDYNEHTGEVEYTLIINATAVARDIKEKVYKFRDEDERDNLLFSLKEMLEKNPNIFFLGETDGTMNDDELEQGAGYRAPSKQKNKKQKSVDDEEE